MNKAWTFITQIPIKIVLVPTSHTFCRNSLKIAQLIVDRESKDKNKKSIYLTKQTPKSKAKVTMSNQPWSMPTKSNFLRFQTHSRYPVLTWTKADTPAMCLAAITMTPCLSLKANSQKLEVKVRSNSENDACQKWMISKKWIMKTFFSPIFR